MKKFNENLGRYFVVDKIQYVSAPYSPFKRPCRTRIFKLRPIIFFELEKNERCHPHPFVIPIVDQELELEIVVQY